MASALTSAVTLNPVAHGGSTTIVITAQFVTTGTDAGDNALQGQSATQSMTWKFMS
jgi:hypothetical protein